MRKILHYLVVLLFLFAAFGCGNTCWFCKKKPQTETNLGQGRKMVAVYNMGITNIQLDSICVADTLSMNFEDWLNTYFVDFETGDTVYKHTFIKSLANKNEIVYVVTEWKDSLAIMKRITK